MRVAVPAPYDHEALWLKAKLFINHALDDEPRTFDEKALWASLSLELLAKAALARVSPLLIATPSEDGSNLLMASGLVEGVATFKSIPAHTLYNRCAKAFRPFSEDQARRITAARNDYLHAGTAQFTHLPPEAWWPRFWAQAHILVNALDRLLEEFVGRDRHDEIEAHLARNKQNIEHRAAMLLDRARQRLAQLASGQVSARIADEWRREVDLSARLSYSANATCPACGEEGLVEGEDAVESTLRHERVGDDDYDLWVDLTIATDYFSCSNCHLVLDGFDVIEAAGAPETFETTTDAVGEWLEPEYGND